MNSGTIWGRFVEKPRGKKSRATVPLKAARGKEKKSSPFWRCERAARMGAASAPCFICDRRVQRSANNDSCRFYIAPIPLALRCSYRFAYFPELAYYSSYEILTGNGKRKRGLRFSNHKHQPVAVEMHKFLVGLKLNISGPDPRPGGGGGGGQGGLRGSTRGTGESESKLFRSS